MRKTGGRRAQRIFVYDLTEVLSTWPEITVAGTVTQFLRSAQVTDRKTLWVQLYLWLGEGTDPSGELFHNRVVVGREGHEQLRKAELARLKRIGKGKDTKDEREKSLFWSDLGSGPQTQLRASSQCELEGDHILLYPANWDCKGKRLPAWKEKISPGYPGQTFLQWLKNQQNRDDPVGDLAVDFFTEPDSEALGLMGMENLKAEDLTLYAGESEIVNQAWGEWKGDADLGTVYFISTEDETSVKIGFTRQDPVSRLNDLQTGNHRKLRLLGSTKGTPRDEKDLHRVFAHAHLQGEWFRMTPDLSSYIQALLQREGGAA